MLLGLPARKQVGKTAAPRGEHAIAHRHAGAGEHKLACRPLLCNPAIAKSVQWVRKCRLWNFELGAERLKRDRLALAQAREHPKLRGGEIKPSASREIGIDAPTIFAPPQHGD